MTVDQKVGRKVHTLMWDQHLTNRAMAVRLGLDESTFSRKLRGGRKWSLDELLEVAAILDVTPEELLPPRETDGGGAETSNGVTGRYSTENVVPLRSAA